MPNPERPGPFSGLLLQVFSSFFKSVKTTTFKVSANPNILSDSRPAAGETLRALWMSNLQNASTKCLFYFSLKGNITSFFKKKKKKAFHTTQIEVLSSAGVASFIADSLT